MKGSTYSMAREVKVIAKDVDLKLKNTAKVCKQGCAHCCNQIIPVHAVEEFSITQFANQKLNAETKSIISKQLEAWIKNLNDLFPNHKVIFEEEYAKLVVDIANNRTACPFLISNECSIYEARPIACRTHYVTDSPGACIENPLRDGEIKGRNVHIEAFTKLTNAVDWYQLRILPYALAEYFGVNQHIRIGIEQSTLISLQQKKKQHNQ